MGKFRKVSLFMLSFVILMSVPKAATCSYEEQAKLNNEASNVKANYEIKERILNKDEYDIPDGIENEEFVAKTDYIQVNILNLTKNIYVEVTNNINELEIKAEAEDSKATVTISSATEENYLIFIQENIPMNDKITGIQEVKFEKNENNINAYDGMIITIMDLMYDKNKKI